MMVNSHLRVGLNIEYGDILVDGVALPIGGLLGQFPGRSRGPDGMAYVGGRGDARS